jgi:bifunctional non-homologous end joining protein LigD
LQCAPARLAQSTEPWNDPNWIFELKYDGFRSLAYVDSQRTRLVSRKNVEYKRYVELARDIAAALGGHDAVLDGEIVCLDANGAPQFYDLLYSRGPVCFAAFDLLSLDGEDLRPLPLLDRKRRLKAFVHRKPGLLYVSHFHRCGTALFKQVCRMDLEGIVAKFKHAPYGLENSWVKVKNRTYSQGIDRGELFKKRSA